MSSALAALAVSALLSAPVQAQWFRRFVNPIRMMPPPAPQNPADKTEDADEADDQDGARPVVLSENGEMRRKLQLVQRMIEGGHHADAARQLGQFLQDPEIRDFFLSRDDERRDGRSFQAEIRRMLRELPPDGLAAYRGQFEPTARARLIAAVTRGGEAGLREVALRFPETQPGDEALYRLGHFLWDHGRAGAAAACFERLMARPDCAAPFEPALTMLAAACWTRLGDSDRARTVFAELRNKMPDAGMQVAGVRSAKLPAGEQLEGFLAGFGSETSPSGAAAGDWPTFRGDARRNRSVPAGAPFLAPRWSHPASTDPRTQLALDRAARAYSQGSGTSLPLLCPLAIGDLVLTRTPRGVAAFDLTSGRCRWQVPTDDEGDNSGLDRNLWQEAAGGAFSADDQCVYLIEDARSLDAFSGGRGANLLSAREHWRAREGKLRWRVGGGDGGAESRLTGAVFLGPPLVWQGRLFQLVELNGALALVVLDRSNGHLEWMQELALVEQAIADDPLRMIAGAMPSISADDVIVCPTSGGAVVAVDLTTQSLLWAYRYARRAPGQPVASIDEIEFAPRLDQFDRWLDATVSIAGGSVVLTPAESREIHCLDLRTGEPRWTQPRGEGLFVACLADHAAVVVGRRQLQALRLIDGAAAWTCALPEKVFPAGRGVRAGARYFLPTTAAAVLEIDLVTGSVAAEHRSPRELSVGNLIWHEGLFISQGPSALEAFDEREELVVQVRDQLKENPRDAGALARQGELELAAGHVAEAIAAFRTAHDAAGLPKTKSKLVSALLEGVRRNLPDSDALSAELDGLIGP
jgi:outer membrane protein assembly factor BamB